MQSNFGLNWLSAQIRVWLCGTGCDGPSAWVREKGGNVSLGMIDFDPEDLETSPRRQLQTLCKERGLRAAGKVRAVGGGARLG